MKVLTESQIMRLHKSLVEVYGGSSAIRDRGLLISAISSPFQTFGDVEICPSLLEKASRLGFGLIKNHPFADGNKRIGTHAMLVFLALNNVELQYNDKDLTNLIINIASGMKDEKFLLEWLRRHSNET